MQGRWSIWGQGNGPHQVLTNKLYLFLKSGTQITHTIQACPHQVLKATGAPAMPKHYSVGSIETLYAYSYLSNKRTCPFILYKKKSSLPLQLFFYQCICFFLYVCTLPVYLSLPFYQRSKSTPCQYTYAFLSLSNIAMDSLITRQSEGCNYYYYFHYVERRPGKLIQEVLY